MKDLRLFSLLPAVFLTVGCLPAEESEKVKGKVTIGKIAWHTNYEVALQEAKKQHKMLWLHFGENPG